MNGASLFGHLIARLERSPTPENKLELEIAKRAHKFRFDAGEIEELQEKAFAYAEQLREVGLFRLPFPEVVFETVNTDFLKGLDDLRTPGLPNLEGSSMTVAWHVGDDIHFRWHQVSTTSTLPAYTTMVWRGVPNQNGLVEACWVHDENLGMGTSMAEFEERHAKKHATKPGELARGLWQEGTQEIAISVALLNLGSGVKLKEIPAPKFINKQRAAKGKPLIYGHTLVTVDYDAVKIPGQNLGGTHASPKVHWRRGHVRTLPDGRKTLVKACLVGAPDRAQLLKPRAYLVKGAPEALTNILERNHL